VGKKSLNLLFVEPENPKNFCFLRNPTYGTALQEDPGCLSKKGGLFPPPKYF